MNGHKHIIFKEVLELTIPNRESALSIQNKTAEIVKQKLNPKLDEIFSKIAGNNKSVRINKLVLDVGPVTEKELEDLFVEKVILEAKKKIGRLLKNGNKNAKQSADIASSTSGSENVKIVPFQKDSLELLLFFLQYGQLPWWNKSSEKTSLEKLFARLFDYNPEELYRNFIPILKETQVRKRLIFQFENKKIESLLKFLDAKKFSSLKNLFQALLVCTESRKYKTLIRNNYYEVIFQYFGIKKNLTSEYMEISFITDILDLSLLSNVESKQQSILVNILKAVSSKQKRTTHKEANYIKASIILIAGDFSSPSLMLTKTIKNLGVGNNSLIANLVSDFISSPTKKEQNGLQQMSHKKTVTKSILKTDKNKLSKPSLDSKEILLFPPKSSDETQEIFINNAGLVIFHPFLRHFFEGLNLLDKNLQFLGPNQIYKAIFLLQYLVSGQESAAEYELLLNKIICGLEISEPIPSTVPLSEKEKEECRYLSETVLERWEALKTKNTEALMQTFLQREGILKQAGQGWNLFIERNTFDVMLEKLPWGYSIIKLPWSSQILYVEW